jgi:16S rRNA (guanine527-N7)-methyltransferase
VASDFAAAARDLGFDLDRQALGRFAAYRDAIIEAAASFNLTAVRDAAAIERRHFLESLSLARLLDDEGLLPAGCSILDIGSGAGLPGLPLKIARPDLPLSLLEANGKRCRFLREVISILDLDATVVLEGRAETLAHDAALRGAFNLVVARAVAPLRVLLELTLPFLEVGGHLAAIKGSAAEREVAASTGALDALGGVVRSTLPLEALGLPSQTLVLVEKTGETPSRYPRREGLPAKRPLS